MKKLEKCFKWFICIVIIFFALTGFRIMFWGGPSRFQEQLTFIWWTSTFEKWLGPTAALVKEGDVAPDFTLKDLNGKEWTLSKLRAKPVLLVFWGMG